MRLQGRPTTLPSWILHLWGVWGCPWIALNLSFMVHRAEVGTPSLGLTGFPGASSHQITEKSCSKEPLCRLRNGSSTWGLALVLRLGLSCQGADLNLLHILPGPSLPHLSCKHRSFRPKRTTPCLIIQRQWHFWMILWVYRQEACSPHAKQSRLFGVKSITEQKMDNEGPGLFCSPVVNLQELNSISKCVSILGKLKARNLILKWIGNWRRLVPGYGIF